MQNDREQVLREYFQLIILLNKGNKLKNQKTELKFNMDGQELKAFLEPDQHHFFVMCLRSRFNDWNAAGYSGFHNLENQLKQLLKVSRNSEELQKNLKTFLFE